MAKIIDKEANFEVDLDNLISFICEGKRNGWASGREPISLGGGFKRYNYQRPEFDGLTYTDTYCGEQRFIGEEIVAFRRTHWSMPIWGMNYFGQFYIPDIIPKEDGKELNIEVTAFLRQQLMHVPENNPFRGPSNPAQTFFKDTKWGRMYYQNIPQKSNSEIEGIKRFHGHEEIYFEIVKTAFGLSYHGGLLVPDSNLDGKYFAP